MAKKAVKTAKLPTKKQATRQPSLPSTCLRDMGVPSMAAVIMPMVTQSCR